MKDIEHRLRVFFPSLLGDILHNKIGAYWFIRVRNSGDLVTPFLLKKYGFTPVHSYPNEAKLVSCGSLIERIPENFSGFMLGTGFIHEDLTKSLKNARILAVRCELTRDRLGAPKDTILGDPGLLVSRFLGKRQKKRYALGIVPHFNDKNDVRICKFHEKYREKILLIDIQRDPLAVLKEIDKCNVILSSSLHGLVFADLLCIPNIWMIFSDKVIGKGYKFNDYNSALKKRQFPLLFTGDENLSDLITQGSIPSNSIVEEVKANLDQAYCNLRKEILQH